MLLSPFCTSWELAQKTDLQLPMLLPHGETSTEIKLAEDAHLEASLAAIEDPTGIHSPLSSLLSPLSSKTYNLTGQCVGSEYKGIIIKNGKKIIR